jgi:Na+-driven multidrug efflux pump
MEQNTKRIFKNAGYLYLRQLLMMALSFFSTRIVLEKLGVDDYGVYNVVGGFVALFTILNNVLQSSTRRFLALAIGRKDAVEIKDTFTTSVILHLIIALIVAFVLETFGVWLLNHSLNIDKSRMFAANWVLQFSIVSVIVSITQTPYTAVVTAHEKFNVYAIMSIYDIGAKIAILFFLVFIPFDKLIVYAMLMCAVSFIGCMIYRCYCIKQFEECGNFKLCLNHSLMKKMLMFSGWDSFGNVASIANFQGITMMLNIFFNTAVNAARGLASTVTTTISQFVTGFVQAAEPQLVKYYGQGDMDKFVKLVFNISQLTLFMLALIAVPVWLEIDYVLDLWLKEVPDYTSSFIQITIFICFITYSNTMLVKATVAIGRVKEISLYMVPVSLIHLPLVFLVLKLGWNPVAVYWVGSIATIMRLFIDLYILRKFVNFPSVRYFLEIFLKNLCIVVIATIVPFSVKNTMDDGFVRFVVVCSISVLSTATLMLIFGLNKEARITLLKRIYSFWRD